MSNIDFSPLSPELEKANDIFILIPQNPNLDQVAAALTLFASLKNTGKNVNIACPSPMRVEFSRLVGVDKVADKIGNRNLVISFDYVKDAIEKVSYNVEGDKFNLVVQPKTGQKPLNSDNVSYSYSGAAADLVFIIGSTRLEDLGPLYEAERKLFTQATTVSIHRLNITPFAKINLHNPQAASISEIVFELLNVLNLPPQEDLATNLLAGIDYATNKFQNPNVNADTFAAASQLLNSGAKRQILPAIMSKPFRPLTRIQPQPSAVGSPNIFQPMTPTVSAQTPPQTLPQNAPTDQPQPQTTPPTTNQNPVPQDWMQPKIFKGSTKV
jgi:hypothetical protein